MISLAIQIKPKVRYRCSRCPEDKTMSITDKGSKAMVVLAIEHTLLKIGNGTLEGVQARLYQEHQCSIQDCYEHPKYLSKILKDLFGTAASNDIIRGINLYLDEFTYQKPIAEFLDKIR